MKNFITRKLNISSIEDWHKEGKGLVYFYQRAFFYISSAKNELLKPLGLWNETLLILTWLAITFDYRPGIKMIVVVYLFASIILLILGKIFSLLKFIQQGASASNSHNPELVEILKRLKDIEDTLQRDRESGKL